MEELGEKTERPEEDRHSTERTTVSVKLDPWGFPKTEASTKELAWAGPRPLAHMEQKCRLVFRGFPQQLKGGCS